VGLRVQPFGVGVVADDLGWVLPEVSYLGLEGFLLPPLIDFVEVNAVFVGERIEDVHILNGVFPPLLVAINKVNPMVDII